MVTPATGPGSLPWWRALRDSRDDAWHELARCTETDPDVFYPEKGGATTSREAKRVCNGHGDVPPCPVREECLADALDRRDRFGVWGGLTERERRQLARRGSAA